MAIPLIVLAIGSLVAGYIGVPAALGGANHIEHFLDPSFNPAAVDPNAATALGGPRTAGHTDRSLELGLMLLATILALAGIAVAAHLYLRRPDVPAQLAERFPRLYRFLLNKGHVDEIYDEAIVQPIKSLSDGVLWQGLDATVIDGAVNGAGTIVVEGGAAVRRIQTGSMRAYALSVLLGAVLMVGYYLWR